MQQELNKIFLPFSSFKNIQRSAIKRFLILLASLPNYPHIIDTRLFFRVSTKYNIYSSKDIIKAAFEVNIYTELYRTIIKDHFRNNPVPKVIGFSMVFQNQMLGTFQCARIIKEMYPAIHITVGGPWASITLRKLQNSELFDVIDSIILDEGEFPLKTLLNEMKKKVPNLNKVPSFIYRKDSEIKNTPQAEVIELQNQPAPDYNMFDLDSYLVPKSQLKIPFRLSKGCVWQRCTFCRTDLYFCRDFQEPDVDLLYDQLLEVIETTGTRFFIFSDESANPIVLEALCKKLIENNVKISWQTHTRVSKQLTKERCKLFAEAGCCAISLGIESLSDRILDLMKKGINTKLIDEVLKEIDGVINIRAYMIIGFPTETKEEAFHNLKKIKEYHEMGLLVGYQFSHFTLVYGSDIWNNPDNYGITEITANESSDLPGDVFKFKGEGMSRREAIRLSMDFNGEIFLLNHICSQKEFTVNGKSQRINFNLNKIAEAFFENSDLSLSDISNMEKVDYTITTNKEFNLPKT